MKIRFTLTLLLFCLGFGAQAQNNGVGTKEPTHTLHVKPDVNNPIQDPLRLENLQLRQQAADSTILVVDPATGVVRYLPISGLINVIGGSEAISNLASTDMKQDTEARTYNIGGQILTFENSGVFDNLLVLDAQKNRIGLGTMPKTGLDLSGIGVDGDGNMNSWDDYRLILEGAESPDKAYGFGTSASGLIYFSSGNHSFMKSGTENMRIKGDGGIMFNKYGQGTFEEANPQKILGLKGDGSMVEISPENLKASPQTLSLNGKKLAISDGNDVDLSSLQSESPWFNIATKKPAEANTDDVYLLGKVGIGTNSPDKDLVVDGSQKVTAQMAIGGNDQDGNYGMTARNSGAGAFFGYVGKNPNIPSEGAAIVAGNNKNIYLFTEKAGAAGSSTNPSLDVNVPRLTIEAESGQVGLGTTAPTKKLDVNGQARIRNIPEGVEADDIMTVDGNGNIRKVKRDDLAAEPDGSIYAGDGTLTQNRAVNTGNFKLNFDANTLVVDGAGNKIGVGTATPNTKLHVVRPGVDATRGEHVALFEGDNSSHAQGHGPIVGFKTALDDGTDLANVGIGATREASSNAVASFRVMLRNDRQNVTFNDTKFTIRANGRTGIGVNNPTKLLDVNGQARIRNFPAGAATDQIVTTDANGNLRKLSAAALPGSSIYSENGTLTENRAVATGNYKLNVDANTFVVDGAANKIGIGTATPNTKLHVVRPGVDATRGEHVALFEGDNSSHAQGHGPIVGFKTALDDGTGLANVGIGVMREASTNAVSSFRVMLRTDRENVTFDDTKFTIRANGRTGIGVTNPTKKLDVDGQARVRDFPAGALTDQIVTTDNAGNLRKMTPDALAGALGGSLYKNNGALTENRDVTTGNFKLNIDENTLLVDGATNRVGVGTDKLAYSLNIKAGNWNGLGIQNDAEEGVVGTLRWTPPNTGGYNNRRWFMLSNETPNNVGTGNDGGIMFRTNSGAGAGNTVPRMVIQDDGKIGVGITKPLNKFHIIGNLNVSNGSTNTVATDKIGNIVGGTNNTVTSNQNLVVGDKNTSEFWGNIIGGQNNKATKEKNIIGGDRNLVTNVANLVVGQIDTVSGVRNLVAGVRNKVGHHDNLVVGDGNKVTRERNLIGGAGNTSTGGQNMIVGARNTTSHWNNLIGGRDNSVAQARNIVGGEKHQITNYGNLVTGAQDTVSGVRNAVSGFRNVVSHHDNVVGGTYNTVSRENNLVVGTRNVVGTYGSLVFGQDNKVSRERNLVGGHLNQVKNWGNLVTGQADTVSGVRNGVVGYRNKVSHHDNVVGGTYNTVSRENNLVVGTKNAVGNHGNIVAGQENKVSRERNVVSGHRNQITNWGNLVTGQQDTVSGVRNMVAGVRNKVAHHDNLVVGELNRATRERNLIGGYSNTSTGGQNLIVGARNTTSHWNNLIGGNDNSITAHRNIVGGDQHTISQERNIVGGYKNKVSNQQNVVGGHSNVVTNYQNLVAGQLDTVLGRRNLVVGYANKVSGHRSLVGGYANFVRNGYNGIVGGSRNTVAHNNSSVIAGSDIISTAHNTAYAQNMSVIEKLGIGTKAPITRLTIGNDILHDARFNYGNAQATFYESTNNGGNVPNGTRDIFHLVREGISGQAYGNKVSFALGRYENASVASRTQLDIKLTDGNFNQHNKVMSLRSNGHVGIGTTAPTQKLSVNGTAGKTGGGTWETFSDARIKKNVAPYTDGLAQLMQIQPKTFQYNGKGGYADDGKTYYGIIAQEMKLVAPYMVKEVKTKDFEDQLSYDGTALTYMLVNAVKEQQTEIEALKKENATLKAQASKVDELSAKLAKIEQMLNTKSNNKKATNNTDSDSELSERE